MQRGCTKNLQYKVGNGDACRVGIHLFRFIHFMIFCAFPVIQFHFLSNSEVSLWQITFIRPEVWIYKLAQSTLNCLKSLRLFLSSFFFSRRLAPDTSRMWSVAKRRRKAAKATRHMRFFFKDSWKRFASKREKTRISNEFQNFPPAFWEKTFRKVCSCHTAFEGSFRSHLTSSSDMTWDFLRNRDVFAS